MDILEVLRNHFPDHVIELKEYEIQLNDFAPRKYLMIDGRKMKISWNEDMVDDAKFYYGLNMEQYIIDLFISEIRKQLSENDIDNSNPCDNILV